MSTPLPLAAASRQLRDVAGFPRRPGRPRKHPVNGDIHGDSAAGVVQPRPTQGPDASKESALASPATAEQPKRPKPGDVTGLWPRLLSFEGLCRYLGLGADVVLELEQAGLLPRVRIPAPVTPRRQGGEIRRALYDREALDRAIDSWREARP